MLVRLVSCEEQTPTTVLETFERLKGHALLSLDPNIRAGMIHDEPAYRALLQRLIALTDILKLSNVDLAWLLPGVSMEESLLHLCGLGPALVIITQGEKGVLGSEWVNRDDPDSFFSD